MVKGVAVKFKSYGETIPKLLELIKFHDELKKHEKIVLKPNLLSANKETSTKKEFLEPILSFIMAHKNSAAEVFIAEGCDGYETQEVFNSLGYTELSEKYGVGLIDLNNTETQEVQNPDFLKFSSIKYPKILQESFVISLPELQDEESEFSASLHNMIGAFPAKHYKGIFSSKKKKLNSYSLEHQIHDIVQCKMPSFTLIDASKKEHILAGQPLEMDKQAAKLLNQNWQSVKHLSLIEKTLSGEKEDNISAQDLISES